VNWIPLHICDFIFYLHLSFNKTSVLVERFAGAFGALLHFTLCSPGTSELASLLCRFVYFTHSLTWSSVILFFLRKVVHGLIKSHIYHCCVNECVEI
jgi:hypothetical protein